MPPYAYRKLWRPLRPRARLAAFRLRSRTTKNTVLAIIFILTLLYFLDRFETSESVLLERLMNSGPSSHPWTVTKSSVDWGKIEYRYPPQPPIGVPKPPRRSVLPRIQHRFGRESSEARRIREARRRAVLRLAKKSWDSYRRYAWKQDALMPLSGTGRDQFSGWAATLVDSLDTLWIMGLRDKFDEAVAAVVEIDFGNSTSPIVNIFETNIRYLGGLLAAYDLSGREVLLQKAVELGDLIYGGFNTENRMPVDMINFEAAQAGSGLVVENTVVSASPGTLTLELTRLSQLTGDPKYYDAITAIVELFYRGQNQTALPGLFPMFVSMLREDVTTGDTFTLGGCADSLYEYFPKLHVLLSGGDPRLPVLTQTFMDAAKRHLFFRPMIPPSDLSSNNNNNNNNDILISGTVHIDQQTGEPHLDPETEHLTCFIGGTFALAGRLLHSEEDVRVGAGLTRGCVYAYRAFPRGLMPERFRMVPCKHDDDEVMKKKKGKACKWDEDRWMEEREKQERMQLRGTDFPKGFTTVTDKRYILRPEAIESVFYMWRITGDAEWQDAAWDMFRAVAEATATELGAAAVVDVTVAKPQLLELEDYMESFWIAETLKYFYLVFSPPELISLDKYVFNTEAHPFLRPRP
ncbi:glycoside hydrolase [Achaetomium macrosporum]|uniref:alpha-1,2-Mannosidase n=1 Tax=Achaetomium macrosporum TaxID=79813 RepID=A0AAN7CCJ1_9PEZI|nr:glycoside hydrolase [Achaetomium macrosporum]